MNDAFLVLRSRIVRRTESLLDFSPTTVSISQYPNSSRLSTLPQGVWNVVQTVGEKIKELENRKIELNEHGALKL